VPDAFLYLPGMSSRPPGSPNCSAILPNLLVGEYPRPGDAGELREARGVTAVVCLQDDADLASKGVPLARLEAAYRRHAIAFHHRPVPDGHDLDLRARLDEIVALLARLVDAGERVYLHCNAGFNRAPTVAIAYLHAHEGLPLDAARDLVKARRPCVPYMRALELHFIGARAERR
jgi:transcriptional regulator of met regulon